MKALSGGADWRGLFCTVVVDWEPEQVRTEPRRRRLFVQGAATASLLRRYLSPRTSDSSSADCGYANQCAQTDSALPPTANAGQHRLGLNTDHFDLQDDLV